MKTYVAPSMTVSEFDNHDIVSCVSCLIRVFGGGREYYHDGGGAPLPDLFYVEYHGTAGNPVPSGLPLYALVADLPIPASSPVRYVGTTQGQRLCSSPISRRLGCNNATYVVFQPLSVAVFRLEPWIRI